MARLRRDLFHTDYCPELRPVVNMSDKVTVKVGVSLHQIINVVRVTLMSNFLEIDFATKPMINIRSFPPEVIFKGERNIFFNFTYIIFICS